MLVTGDAGESYETLYAVHRFREAGFQPVIAAPSRRRLHLVMHDFAEGWDTYIERPGYELPADVTFDEVNVADFDGVLILGGRAPEYLRNDLRVLGLIHEFEAQQKWVFAICHGIQVLISAGICSGRRLTCYEHVRYEVEANGGEYVTEQAIRDGRVVTGQTWQSHPEFYRLVFECLNETS